MAAESGHISWKMPIVSSTPLRPVPIETPSRVWSPFIQSKLPFEHQSPILPNPAEYDHSGITSSIEPHISASASDDALRSSLSAVRAELSNSTFQIDHLRKLVLDLEQENAQLKSDCSSFKQQQRVQPFLSRPSDDSTGSIVQEQELRRVQDELNHCEERYQEAAVHHRLEMISLEADRDAKARELTRVQQELEEVTVLYKGKTRCLEQLKELHEAQFSNDGHSKAEDKKRIDALTSHVAKLRDALSCLKLSYETEKTKCLDQQNRLQTMKRLLEEANNKYEKCNSELLSAREEIDELLTQLSEIDSKRKQAGGDCVHQGPAYKSDVVSAAVAAAPARSSTPSDLSGMVNQHPQRVVAYKDASTCTFADTISGTVHPDSLQKKLLYTEAQLSAERATICQLRSQIVDMEQRELESEKLCDMLQSEIEKIKKPCNANPALGLEKADGGDSKSTLLELCVDECNELRRQNSELAAELDQMRNLLAMKDGELQKLRVRMSQRPIPLHNPVPSNDATTVINDTVTQAGSFSQIFSPIASTSR